MATQNSSNNRIPTPPVITGSASPSYAQGKLAYDTDNEALTFFNNEADVALQIGQELWIRVRNVSGSTITNGSAVYINGNNTGLPTIALARADSVNTTFASGLATHSIENNTIGYITAQGVVRNLDTSGFANGAVVYLSSTVNGGLTTTAPGNPNYRVRMGVVTNSNATTGSIFVDLSDPVNTVVSPAAGTTSASPVLLTAGTLMTTPSDGAIEMDGDCFYGTVDAGNRGYMPVRHFIRADATRTLPNDTNENAIFNSPANGRITLETGTYLFTGLIYITSMSATSGNASFDILGAGTATCAAWLWHAIGIDNNTPTNVATQTGAWSITQQSVAAIVTAGTGTAMAVNITGTVEVTGAGTLIPSVDQLTASAAVVAIGSYMTFERIGSTSVVSVGQWD